MGLKEEEIEKKVILLKMLLREPNESVEEALGSLVDTKMFDMNRAKELYGELERDGYIKDGSLTMLGEIEARKAKEEFTLAN